MTVCDLCELYVDDYAEMKIWDVVEEKYVFEGTFRDASFSEFENETVGSFEIEDGMIIINI